MTRTSISAARRSALGIFTLAFAACQQTPSKPAGDPRPAADAELPVRPPGPVGREEAGRYVLALVNYHRGKHGLAAVEWDDTAAKAGQRHAEDMAKSGFTGHWGTDGSVPEQRYTEAGGTHFAQENAACFFDAESRELDPNPMFQPELLEQIENAFYNETPPNDGHRQNILKPWHNKLGVGLAKPQGIDQPCMAQEFLDAYGDYDGIPQKARLGQSVDVAGEVVAPVEFGAVGIGRIDPAEPIAPEELNQTATYRVPDPFELFFPKGFVTRVPVAMEGARFSMGLKLAHDEGPGRYEISIWGRYPEDEDLVMVSLRTVVVK